MTQRNKTANIYTEWLPLVDSLPNEIAGVIFKNILKYQNGEGIDSTFPVWLFIKSKIDEYNNRLLQISEKRKENGKLGGLAKASKCYQMLASDSKCSNKIKENKTKENKIENTEKEISDFSCFWENYTPVQASDGRFVSKGSKSACQEKYIKLLKQGVTHETIINGLKQYLSYCRANGYCSCGAEVFLNQRRFENDYSGNGTVSSRPIASSGSKGASVIDIAREFISETENHYENGMGGRRG